MNPIQVVRTVDDALVRDFPDLRELRGKCVEVTLRELDPVFPAGYYPEEPVLEDEPDWDPDAIVRVTL